LNIHDHLWSDGGAKTNVSQGQVVVEKVHGGVRVESDLISRMMRRLPNTVARYMTGSCQAKWPEVLEPLRKPRDGILKNVSDFVFFTAWMPFERENLLQDKTIKQLFMNLQFEIITSKEFVIETQTIQQYFSVLINQIFLKYFIIGFFDIHFLLFI
jgi:hypothetical protein